MRGPWWAQLIGILLTYLVLAGCWWLAGVIDRWKNPKV